MHAPHPYTGTNKQKKPKKKKKAYLLWNENRAIVFQEKLQVFGWIFKLTPKVPAWFLIINLWKKNTAKEVRGENREHLNFICFFCSPFIIICRNSTGADNMQITCNWESQKQPKKYLKWQRSSWKRSCSFREQWRSFTTLIEINWSYRRSAVFEKIGRKPK